MVAAHREVARRLSEPQVFGHANNGVNMTPSHLTRRATDQPTSRNAVQLPDEKARTFLYSVDSMVAHAVNLLVMGRPAVVL